MPCMLKALQDLNFGIQTTCLFPDLRTFWFLKKYVTHTVFPQIVLFEFGNCSKMVAAIFQLLLNKLNSFCGDYMRKYGKWNYILMTQL